MRPTGPPYVEGYPRLIASEVRRAYMSDEEPLVLCRFFTTSGQARGWLEILTENIEDGFGARWKFVGPGLNSDVGRGKIGYTFVSGKVGRPAPFRCQKCKRQVGNLVFTSYWACGRCHGLRNRSTFLQPNVLEAEQQAARLDVLRQRIGSGRPRLMRQQTYRSLKEELRQLERLAARYDFPVANRDRTNVVVSEWMSEERARREHGFNPHLIFVDGTPLPNG